jgi:hypothetical protein
VKKIHELKFFGDMWEGDIGPQVLDLQVWWWFVLLCKWNNFLWGGFGVQSRMLRRNVAMQAALWWLYPFRFSGGRPQPWGMYNMSMHIASWNLRQWCHCRNQGFCKGYMYGQTMRVSLGLSLFYFSRHSPVDVTICTKLAFLASL